MAQSLWDFSVELYARPGVAAACLALQDRAGADVCLLLAALWLERRGVAATAARLAQLERLAAPWQASVVAPLRDLRRAWKTAAGNDAELAGLRRQLADLELQAERQLLQRLETLAGDWPAAAQASTGWLERLGNCRENTGETDCRAALQMLRDAAAD